MVRRRLMIVGRGIVIEDAEIRSGFEPEIIWLARVKIGRVVILVAIAGQRQQRVIDVGRAERFP